MNDEKNSRSFCIIFCIFAQFFTLSIWLIKSMLSIAWTRLKLEERHDPHFWRTQVGLHLQKKLVICSQIDALSSVVATQRFFFSSRKNWWFSCCNFDGSHIFQMGWWKTTKYPFMPFHAFYPSLYFRFGRADDPQNPVRLSVGYELLSGVNIVSYALVSIAGEGRGSKAKSSKRWGPFRVKTTLSIARTNSLIVGDCNFWL